MAAVTGVITAVAGLGLTAYQMYEQDQAGKEAKKSAEVAANRLKSLQERDTMAAVQTPDISSLAFESIAQSEAQGLQAIQGMGTEAAIGGVTSMVEQGRQQALQVAERQAVLESETDFKKAQNAQAIENRKIQREAAILSGEVAGAQQAAADADLGKQAAMMDLVQGVGNVATGIGQATSLEATAQRQSNQSSRQAMNQAQAQSDYLADANLAYNSGIFNDGEKGINANYGKYLNYLQSGAEQINRP
jgi:hypothetical protein